MVTPDEVAAELGRTTPDSASAQYAQWVQWINDAELLTGVAAKSRGTDISALDPELVDFVVRKAVAQQAILPADAARQVTTSVDDGSSSRTYATGDRLAGIPDGLLALLFPTRTAFTIVPGCP